LRLTVGEGRDYASVSDALPDAEPGDVIEVDGDAVYPPVEIDVGGTAESPLVIRGISVNGRRPVFSGGTDTLRISADHVVLENLEITQGSERCLFLAGDGLWVRRSVIHDCPRHGILGADYGTGRVVLDQDEVHHCGSWPEGENLKHPVYVATDPSLYPDAALRVMHCFLHDNPGGNAIKSRAGRLEVYFNWIETSESQDAYYSVESVGFEEFPSEPGQNADIVGNVLVHLGTSGMRFGGDGTGAMRGQARLVHNTVLLGAGFDEYTPVIRLSGESDSEGNPGAIAGLESLGNVYYRLGGGALQLVRDDATWVGGEPRILFHGDWVPSGSSLPEQSASLLEGASPGYASAQNASQLDLSIVPAAPIEHAGSVSLAPASGHDLPGALVDLSCMPPSQRPTSLEDMAPRSRDEAPPPTLGAISAP